MVRFSFGAMHRASDVLWGRNLVRISVQFVADAVARAAALESGDAVRRAISQTIDVNAFDTVLWYGLGRFSATPISHGRAPGRM